MFRLWPRRLRSIRYKFVISTFVFMLLFTFTLISIWFATATKDAEKSAVSYMSELLHMSNENLEVALKDVNAIISLLSVNSSNNYEIAEILKKDDKATEKEQYEDNLRMVDLLTRLSNNKYYLSGIMLGSVGNNYFQSGIMMSFEKMKSQPWHDEIVNATDGERVFVPPHLYDGSLFSSGSYKDLVFSYAKTINSEGKPIGFVLADVRYQILVDIFNRKVKDNGYIFIADSKLGELIYPYPGTDKPFLGSTDEFQALLAEANRLQGSFYTRVAGKSFLVIYQKSAFTGWITLGLIPKENLLASFYKARNYMLLLTFLLSLLAAAVLYVMGRMLTGNIRKLYAAVARVDRDNLEPLSLYIRSDDEIGHLYNRINSMIRKIQTLIQDIRLSEKEKRKAEVRLLQSQINPHFLHNTLNTIKFIATLQGMNNIKTITESLSSLLHITMDKGVFISVSEEVRYIQNYLSIQHYKYNNVTYHIDAEESVSDWMTLKLILQPIVENALIHGLPETGREGIIAIRIFQDGQFLKMRVQDNGVGMAEDAIRTIMNGETKGPSIGLQNTLSRIRMNFGEDYGISIVSQKGLFTTVEVSLPILTKEEVDSLD